MDGAVSSPNASGGRRAAMSVGGEVDASGQLGTRPTKNRRNMARYLNMRDLMRTLSPDVTIVGGDAQLPQQAPAQPDTGVLAARFENLWLLCGGPTLEREYRFHPVRKWRADYCHAATKTIVELEGGVYGQGRHLRSTGFLGDIEKYNAAQMAGFVVLRLGTGQVDHEHVAAIVEYVKRKEVQG